MRKNKIEKKCEKCGKMMSVTPARLADGRGKFCSKECARNPPVFVECPVCGVEFKTHQCFINIGAGKYCSIACSAEARRGVPSGRKGIPFYDQRKRVVVKCKQCEKEFEKQPADPKKFCSRKCASAWRKGKSTKKMGPGPKGAAATHWKGGTTTCNGYILSYCPNHPSSRKGVYIREHRLVAEKVLGRTLEPGEIIHHINGDVADNRVENLYLFESNSAHTTYHHTIDKELITKSNLI